jgi:hypothetical protein
MEAFAIVIVFVVAAGVYVGARFGAHAAVQSPAQELARLHAYRAALREKLARGRRENWDAVMMAQVADKLGEAERRIAELTAGG